MCWPIRIQCACVGQSGDYLHCTLVISSLSQIYSITELTSLIWRHLFGNISRCLGTTVCKPCFAYTSFIWLFGGLFLVLIYSAKWALVCYVYIIFDKNSNNDLGFQGRCRYHVNKLIIMGSVQISAGGLWVLTARRTQYISKSCVGNTTSENIGCRLSLSIRDDLQSV